ncbi:MAG: response regulator transcription factor [Myxococcota bacterium]
MSEAKILIVEDDHGVAGLLRRGLEEESFEVTHAATGDAGLREAATGRFGCMVLDLMLPGKNGLDLCREIRAAGVTTPVIMLTVRGSTGDKVAGLDVGADDYITKPFSFKELLARIRAQLRRRSEYAGRVLKHAGIELDLVARNARRGGGRLELSPKEFTLLEYMMHNAGRVVTEQDLIEHVWGLAFDPKTNIVSVYMHHLRRKLDLNGWPPAILTVRGRGYTMGGEP